MEPLFIANLAEQLAGPSLDEARLYLLRGLRQTTGIPLKICGDEKTIHCTDVHTRDPDASRFALLGKDSLVRQAVATMES